MSLGIYVHLPFCPYICPYCDFAKWPMRRSSANAYLDALLGEIEREPPAPAGTIFLGGGTPNAYEATTIARLVRLLRERFPSADARGHEISIETNPELVRPGDFEEYVAAGVTRLSVGVQSFDPDEIRTLGRKHTPEQVRSVVKQARAAGIHSVSLDLMFAVPGQGEASWSASLEQALDLGVDHISTYGLTIEEHTRFDAWYAREPLAFFDDAREAELYAIAIDRLEGAGFEHYEISNFARPGHQSLHNANYWANGEYIGLGVGAASYRAGERSVHTRDLREYLAAASTGAVIPGQSECLEGYRRIGEAIMLALRTARGVDFHDFQECYGLDVPRHYAAAIAKYSEVGLLENDGRTMRLTKQGRFVANDVCGAFLSLE
ncbi:MAG: radical SAM family heme chaperone HemW [Vulcanimicrobiaceae bacterium]